MSDIDDLIIILGAIDSRVGVVEDNADEVNQMMNLVPPYRAGDSFGWYREFLAGREEVEGLPTVDQLENEEGAVTAVHDAIVSLGEPTRYASMLPRRLLATALAARVFPGRFGPGGDFEADVLGLLAVPGILADLDQAERLLADLADPTQLRTIEDWPAFLTSRTDFLSAELLRLPPPCSTKVIERQGPGAGPITVLQTELCVGGVDLQTVAARFLDPLRWPHCSLWWCDMLFHRDLGQGLKRYLECVADDCAHPRFLDVAVFLDFATFLDHPDRKVVTYNMSGDQRGSVGQLRANRRVDVDRGVIEIRQEPSHVHVSTTKRVRFTQPINVKALAMFACWLGYGEVANDMICNCSGGRRQWIDCDVRMPLTDACRRFVELAYSCVEDATEEARRASDRLGSGAYNPDAVAAEATRMAGVAVRGWAKIATTFVDAFADVVRPPAPSSAVAPAGQTKQCSFQRSLPCECTLSLAGPMRSPYGDEISTNRVAIDPSQLGPGGLEFRLIVNDAGLEGSAYLGRVLATSVESGNVVDSVLVDVIIP